MEKLYTSSGAIIIMEKFQYLNQLSKQIHANNVAVGWWDGEQCPFQKLQLVSTEIAEATEGARKDLRDDHLPQHRMEVVELADALIRVLDFGGKYEFMYTPVGDGFNLMGENLTTGSNHMGINCVLVDFVKAFYLSQNISEEGSALDSLMSSTNKQRVNMLYSALIDAICYGAHCSGYSYNKLITVLHEKLEYNKNRLDHKKDQRLKEGGKKF